jgi:hypothetical protein
VPLIAVMTTVAGISAPERASSASSRFSSAARPVKWLTSGGSCRGHHLRHGHHRGRLPGWERVAGQDLLVQLA